MNVMLIHKRSRTLSAASRIIMFRPSIGFWRYTATTRNHMMAPFKIIAMFITYLWLKKAFLRLLRHWKKLRRFV